MASDRESILRDNSENGRTNTAVDEDIRAAAASAMLAIADKDWLALFSPDDINCFMSRIWGLLANTTSDVSPFTGPLLNLICALTRAECILYSSTETTDKWASNPYSGCTKLLSF